MGWYDGFARFYDSSLEALYADARVAAAEKLDLGSATRVLDLPTGTGQSLDAIVARLPAGATVVGADLSSGMLARAHQRVVAKGYADRVELVESDVHAITDVGAIDRLHVFLGLSTFPRYEEAFERLFNLLAPGGRAVVVDVHAERIGMQGRLVEFMARADLRRRAWEPLERLSEGFEKIDLTPDWRHGGTLWLASGDKPA